MILSKFIEGLQILQQYFKKDGFYISAEHDQFFVYSTDIPVTEKDVARLRELGWYQPETYDNDTDEDGEYDPEEGWSTYV